MEVVRIGFVQLAYPYKNMDSSSVKSPTVKKIIKKKGEKKLVFSEDSEISDDEEEKEEEEDWKNRNGRYEVEEIIDRCDFGNGEVFYLVKWKFWQDEYNSWEPVEHLDCEKRINKYLKRIVYRHSEEAISKLIESLAQPTKTNLENMMTSLYREKEEVTITIKSEYSLRQRACSVQRMAKKKRGEIKEQLGRDLLLKYLFVRRCLQIVALKEWQEEMNRLCNDPGEILVENEYDLEGPPDNFFYVNQYIPGPNVTIPDDPPLGCKCRVCDAKSDCCSSLAKFRFAYTQQGLLKISSHMPIYECNKRCMCKSNCSNRIVQKGCKVKLCIFRTLNNCGWGVKAVEDIKKGTYVCTYFGEVIDNNDAEVRIEKYQHNQDTYLFDMDYNGANYKYTVDATDYGTIARFINHSCSPNLTVCFVWIDCLDPSLPHLAYFASDFIAAGQELTIDYVGDTSKIDANIIRKTKPCRCGSEQCKNVVF